MMHIGQKIRFKGIPHIESIFKANKIYTISNISFERCNCYDDTFYGIELEEFIKEYSGNGITTSCGKCHHRYSHFIFSHDIFEPLYKAVDNIKVL